MRHRLILFASLWKFTSTRVNPFFSPKPQVFYMSAVKYTFAHTQISPVTPNSSIKIQRDGSLFYICACNQQKYQQTWILSTVCYRFSLNQHGVLTIKGALPEDAGNYTCLASNEAGTASQSVSLSYAGKSTHPDRCLVEDASAKIYCCWN